MLTRCRRAACPPPRRRLHVLTDGRDVPDGSSIKFVDELEGVLKELQASYE